MRSVNAITRLILWLTVGTAVADELNVPGVYPTIQFGIDAASDGDVVLLAPGIYSEAVDLRGKRITVRGSGGAAATILDGAGLGVSILSAQSGETLETSLEGLTFRDGEGTSASNCVNAGGYVGGAIHLRNGGLTVQNCTFSGNGNGAVAEMTGGGAIYAHASELALLDSTFADNGHWAEGQAGDGMHSGGAVFACGGTLTIERCTFTNNGPTGHGGAVRFDSQGDVNVIDSRFLANQASHGAGLRISQSHGAALVQNCSFNDNVSSHGGGVNVNSNGRVDIADCEFSANQASFGGGLNLRTDVHGAVFPPESVVRNCVFEENAAGYGGGLLAEVGGDFNDEFPSTALRIHGCEFLRNVAGNCCNTGLLGNECFSLGGSNFHGGAASLGVFYGPHLIEVINCAAIGNLAVAGGAFHFYTCGGGDIRCVNGTMAGNSPNALRVRVDEAPSFQFPTSSVEIANSILWNNGSAGVPEASVTVDSNPGLSAAIVYSDVQGGFAGDGNIDLDPQFADVTAGNYSIRAGSPCIDAGRNEALPAGVAVDLAGHLRFVDDPDTADTGVGTAPLVDIGAYEFQISECPGDLDGSGDIGLQDLALLLANFGGSGPALPGDLDADNDVDLQDLATLLSIFGSLC